MISLDFTDILNYKDINKKGFNMSFTDDDHDLMERLYDNHKLDNSSKDVYYDYVKMVNEFLTSHNFKQNIKLYDDSDKPLPILNVIQEEKIPYKFPWDDRNFNVSVTKFYKIINICCRVFIGNPMTRYLHRTKHDIGLEIRNDLRMKILSLPKDIINKEFVAFMQYQGKGSDLELFVKLRHYQPA